jgi:hypothetical protein
MAFRTTGLARGRLVELGGGQLIAAVAMISTCLRLTNVAVARGGCRRGERRKRRRPEAREKIRPNLRSDGPLYASGALALPHRQLAYKLVETVPEGKRMASGLTRNQVLRKELGVRVPCPPLQKKHGSQVGKWQPFASRCRLASP